MISYAAGTITAFILVLIQGNLTIPTGSQAVGMLWNGIICNALPYLTWALALDLGNTAVIANLAYLTPFVSLILTHFVLGLVLIVTGIIIQMIVNKKMEASEI